MAHSIYRYNNFNKDNFNPSRHNGKLVEQVRVKNDEKQKLRRVGDWSEQISTAGKKYFYNCKTEVSQWEKPPEWIEYETKHGSFDKHRKPIMDDIKSNESSHSASAKPCSSSDFVDHERFNNNFNNDRPSTTTTNYNSSTKSSSKRNYYNKNDNRYHHRSSQHAAPTTSATIGQDVRNHNYARNAKNNRNNEYANSYSDRSNQSDHSNEQQQYRQRERWKRDRSPPANDRRHGGSGRKRRRMGNGGPLDGDETFSFPALEKIKQHLKEALSHVVAELPTNVVQQQQHAESSQDVAADDAQQPVLQSADTDNLLETKEEFIQVDVEPPLATLSESHANFYSEQLTLHVRNWSSIHFENQAQHLSDRSFQSSLDVAQVSADLKCARSLVRTAEIRSTLLEQRISYLRQQHQQLDTMNSKPASSTSAHA